MNREEAPEVDLNECFGGGRALGGVGPQIDHGLWTDDGERGSAWPINFT